MIDANWVLAGVTFILVLLTGWYATEMRRTVKRMDRQLEEMSRPYLTFQLVPWQPQLLKLRVQNVGNGPAMHIAGTIESVMDSGSTSVHWGYPMLAAGKYEEFGFPVPSGSSNDERFRLDSIKAKINEVRAEFVYNSASGCQYELKDTIQVKQVTEDWASSRMMATQDHPERILPRIAKALEDLAKNLPSR